MSYYVYDVVTQRLSGQHYDLVDGRVQASPTEMRYAWPAELDLMARLAGMRLAGPLGRLAAGAVHGAQPGTRLGLRQALSAGQISMCASRTATGCRPTTPVACPELESRGEMIDAAPDAGGFPTAMPAWAGAAAASRRGEWRGSRLSACGYAGHAGFLSRDWMLVEGEDPRRARMVGRMHAAVRVTATSDAPSAAAARPGARG